MKQLTVGLTAHVDAGKTTLAEALLFRTGEIRKRGRVDHGDSWLDTSEIERSRGITVFAHQASLTLGDTVFTLLDTPGHVDFSAETERIMQVLDYAVLVISGTDGVQSHTRTLWKLLARCGVPVILFVNKMDISDRTENALMQELQGRLSAGCVQFDTDYETVCENAAACSEALMAAYFEDDTLSQDMLRDAIAARQIFPVCFGAARDLTGVESLLQILAQYTKEPERPETFGAHVFKISADAKGNRLTYLKIRGGTLHNRDELRYTGADHAEYTEKVTGIRFYSGAKYTPADEAEPGAVCAVTGLTAAYAGLGIGCCGNTAEAVLTPVMRYRVILPETVAPQDAMTRASEALKLVGIKEEYYSVSPLELSGGQKRRVAIAGILACDPRVVVLDEPTAGLDPHGAKEMIDLFVSLNRKQGKMRWSTTIATIRSFFPRGRSSTMVRPTNCLRTRKSSKSSICWNRRS